MIPLAVIVQDGLRGGLSGLWHAVSQPVAAHALWLTLWTAVVMVVVNTVMGALTAYVLVRYTFPGKSLLNGIVDVPLAIPTLVTGVMLVILFGPQEALGGWLDRSLGLQIIFAPPGIILALLFVTFPFVVRAVQPVLLGLDRAQEDAAATLGITPPTPLPEATVAPVEPITTTGETGEQKTVEYLTRAFAAAGLEPGGVDGSWVQPVPLVRLDRAPGAKLSLRVGDEAMPLAVGEQATLALRNAGRTEVEAAPLVFGGYGVVDPARGWDAYAGVDLRGRIVVVLANDPDFEVKAADVIPVFMGVKDSIKLVYTCPKHLLSEIGTGIDHDHRPRLGRRPGGNLPRAGAQDIQEHRRRCIRQRRQRRDRRRPDRRLSATRQPLSHRSWFSDWRGRALRRGCRRRTDRRADPGRGLLRDQRRP